MGSLLDCFRGSTNEQSRQSDNVITPDTDVRRQAAAEAAHRRFEQSEKRGVDEDALHQMKQRQSELERQQAKLAKQTDSNSGGLRWQMN